MVPQTWIIECLKIFKIFEKVVINLKGGQSLAEVQIQSDIFQEDTLLPLLFVIEMIPLNYILQTCTGSNKFTNSQEKINHLMYIDYIKIFVRNEKELETLIQTIRMYNQEMRMEFGIEKFSMLIIKKRKRETMCCIVARNMLVP